MAENESTYAIEFEKVSFSYDGEHPALQGIDLQVAPGEFIAVVGANGSGKSTLAKHANALLAPSEGTVRAYGVDTRDEKRLGEVRRRVGMVFQNPDNQSVAPVVKEDVAFGPRNLGLGPEEVQARVEKALAEVGMAEHAEDEIHSLSGGQKQLVAIAGVLAMEPEAIVLDEPGAMLDVRGRQAVMRIVRGLHDRGLTVVLITHFMEDVLEADRVAVLEGGRIALEGTPAEVFARGERLRALHLALPFSVELAFRLKGCGLPVGDGIVESELAEELCALSVGKATEASHVLEVPLAEDGAGAPSAPLIAFDRAGFSYDGTHEVLSDLSFGVREGELLGIIGHTGSGKSTLVQLMNALLVPTAGRVSVNGMDTAQRKLRRKVRGTVGLVFQYPETQLFATTVAEDLAFGPKNLKLGKDEVEQRCRRALERVGLDYDEFAQRSPFALSGGQQRRVAIAGILAMEPEVLVLDEPAAGLDPQSIAEMEALLARLNDDGTTVVLISHSMEEVAELCDRVLVLDDGACRDLGAPERVFAPKKAAGLRAMGLDVPRATGFAIELARRGLDLGGPILNMDQLVAALCGRLEGKA